ncbi:MAG: peptide deformylase, partial [Pseudomonadota bacterium]
AVRKLADDMLETMYDAPGVGLAAPQVGVIARMFVMDCNREDAGQAPTVVINPEILWNSEETATYEEGCLSIPEIFEDVTRPQRIRLGFTDETGMAREEEYEGLWATCAQHEIDHLNGKLFIDYLGAVKRGLITTKMRKLKRERARV